MKTPSKKSIENKRENGDLIRDFLMANNTSGLFNFPIRDKILLF